MKLYNAYGDVIFESETATNKGELAKEARAAGHSLYRADLYRADLYGANLSGADLSRADLSRANLSGADLSRADLSGADLSRADLYGADLSGADLYGADLSGADLSGADLYGADLSGARGVNPWKSTPLMMLYDQPGRICAYKLVNEHGEGPIHGGVKYEMGATIEDPNADTDPTEHCGPGANVATLDWCMREWMPGYRILIVEFEAADIAAIPHGTDGKFRLHRCTVVGEKDLQSVGLIGQAEPARDVARR